MLPTRAVGHRNPPTLHLFCPVGASKEGDLVFENDSNNMCFKFASFLICALEQAKTVLPLKGETMINNRVGCVVVTYYA